MRVLVTAAALVLIGWGVTACDVVEPEGEPRIVVAGFLQPGKAVPGIHLTKTGPIDAGYPAQGVAITEGEVKLRLDEESLEYRASTDRPGHYLPEGEDAMVQAGQAFQFTARWNGQVAQAGGRIPPQVAIDSVHVDYTEEPVRAIFVDSLFLDPIVFDSLWTDSSSSAEEGYAYSVEVTVWWTAPDDYESSDYWARTRLRPELPNHATLDDFFLRSEQIQIENAAACESVGEQACSEALRAWTGVYGIPVPNEGSPFPSHRLNIAVIRSGEDYARFASTRHDPERREPISNVDGGLGIVAGIALDSLNVRVR